LIVSAVEELLRYDSPVQKMARIALADIDVDGKRIKRGELVCFCFGGANRDPEQFASPGKLDIARKPNRHLAFGHGLHYCVGAALARVEGQIAVNTLLRRLPMLALEDEHLDWHRNFTLRGLKSLPVAF
jgi:pimeloyl-[acyl-carrier protein] synthase